MIVVISENDVVRDEMIKMLAGFEVDECINFLDAIETVFQKQNSCKLVLSDYDLIPYNGVELLATIKKINATIKTVLLVNGENIEAKIEGLRSDVDLIMDCKKNELVNRAYIDKLLKAKTGQLVYIEGTNLIVDGKSIKLSRIDVQIVRILLDNSNKVIDREEILEKVWGQSNQSTRKVEMHVRAVRKALENEGVSGCIITVSGVGYKWIYNPSA